MSRQSDLFSDPPTPEDGASAPAAEEARPPSLEAPPVLSVSEFNERVASALKGRFPAVFRIQGFVSGFARSFARGGHVYFELHEKDPEDESRDVARVSMVIWRGVRQRLRRDIEALGGSEGELDDQQIYFEVSVNYWIQGGRLSLQVEGLDVEASLGAQKLDRDRILRLLAADGLLDENRKRYLAALPLRLLLITSLESAAYHDFIKELSLAGISFSLACLDARVQGPDQEADMQSAFARVRLLAEERDAVVLIRGGGSRADLMGFDSEALARAIAHCPLPVLTGIGHEIDRAIADEVAHRAFKTPTAVAQFLVQRVEDWVRDLEERALRVGREAERSLVLASRRLDRDAQRLPYLMRASLAGGERRLGLALGRIPAALRQRLRVASLELSHRARRLAPAASEILARSGKELEHRSERLRLLDPINVLKRGFSLTRDPQGGLLRSVADIKIGEELRTRLSDGEVTSRVEKTNRDGRKQVSQDRKRSMRKEGR